MGKTISIVNEKGGCAKTTTAYSLAQGLFMVGYKVLGVDMDSQGNFPRLGGAIRTALVSMMYSPKTSRYGMPSRSNRIDST